MDFNKIIEGFKSPYFSSNFHQAAIIDDKVYLSNSGDYLMSIGEVKSIIEACTKYLDHITDDEIIDFNKRLRDERVKEDESFNSMSAKKTPRPTFIYLMVNKRNGLYKIGKSDNPSIREKTLQSEEPEIELIYSFPGTSETENRLHTMYNGKRVRGEWFKLDPTDVEFIKTLS